MNSFHTVFIALAAACLAVAGTASAQDSNNRTVPMGATGVDTSHIKTKSRADPVAADQPTAAWKFAGQARAKTRPALVDGDDDVAARGHVRGEAVVPE